MRHGMLAAGMLALGAALAAPATAQPERVTAASAPEDVPIHDPVLSEADGTYYVFGTGRGIDVWASDDLREWRRLGPVFAETPPWVLELLPDFRNHIWAPDIFHHDGTYHLYYSVSAFGRNNSAIGVATTPTLDPEDPAFESPAQIFVGDSKLIHREGWPDELERAALSLLGWSRGEPLTAAEQALEIAGRFDAEPVWLHPEHQVFPLAPASLERVVRLDGRAVTPVWMGARVLSTRQFNAACAQTENKAVVNWALVAMLIEAALEQAGGEPVEIVVDRQGGRVHYEALLRQLLDAEVRVVEKRPRRSAYEVDDDRVRSIEFRLSLIHI